MTPTQVPSPQELQQRISTTINNTTHRYQSAITNPNSLAASIQPVMHPADSFFAPPSANPRLTTCLVCAAPFRTHAELCQHVERDHSALYLPSQVQMPPVQSFAPFPRAAPLVPLEPLPPPHQLPNPWSAPPPLIESLPMQPPSMQSPPMQSPPMQTPISVPPNLKPALSYRCETCDVGCDTMDSLNAHLAGQKHRKRHELREAFQKVLPKLHAEGISEVNPRLWMCQLCQVQMDSENAVLQHLDASKHKRLRQNPPPSSNDRHKRLRSSPVTALQAAEDVTPTPPIEPTAATPVSAALAVLKDDNVPLPSASSLFPPCAPISTTSYPISSLPPSTGYTQQQPGALRTAISKNPRPSPKNLSGRQAGQSFSCAVCGVSCNSMDSLNAHLASVRHKRKLNSVDAANNPATNNPATLKPQASSPNIRCDVCGVMICGQLNFEVHVKGKQHAKKLKALESSGGAPQSPASTSISPAPTPPHSAQMTVTPIEPTIQRPTEPPHAPVQVPVQVPFQAPMQVPIQARIQAPYQAPASQPAQTPSSITKKTPDTDAAKSTNAR